MRLTCQLCGRKVSSGSFRKQFAHAVKYHPDVVWRKILPLATNPKLLDEATDSFVRFIRRNLIGVDNRGKST